MQDTTSTTKQPPEATPTPEDETVRRPTSVRRIVLLGAALVLVGAISLSYTGLGDLIRGEDVTPRASAETRSTDPSEPNAEEVASREERWRRDVIGDWKTYYKGVRLMTVRPDGTATIVANLTDYAWHETLLVGAKKVTFEIVWDIEDGHLVFDTVGGEPAASVNVITGVHGSSKRFEIVHVTDDEFRYHSDDPGEDDYVWERVTTE